MTSSTHKVNFPKAVRVREGTIVIPSRLDHISSGLDDIEFFARGVLAVLDAVPESDKQSNYQYCEEGGWHIKTKNENALKLAHANYMLDPYFTGIDSLSEYIVESSDGEVSKEDALEQVGDLEDACFEISALGDGHLYACAEQCFEFGGW